MRILLSGPPGTGKSVQASLIAKKYNIVAVSAGNLLRKEIAGSTEIGKKIKPYVENGDLAPDDLVDEVVKAETKKHPSGFIMDGYPRDLYQAKKFNDFDIMIVISTTENEIIKRLKLRKRKDDDIKVIKHRFKIYHKQTKPVIGYYKKQKKNIKIINGIGSIKEVYERILKALDKS